MLHFSETEFAERLRRTREELAARELDGLLLFAPESQFWLTGYDTFGFCFFQCLVVGVDQDPVLLTRSADYRQAQLTSNISDIRVWRDQAVKKEDKIVFCDTNLLEIKVNSEAYYLQKRISCCFRDRWTD